MSHATVPSRLLRLPQQSPNQSDLAISMDMHNDLTRRPPPFPMGIDKGLIDLQDVQLERL